MSATTLAPVAAPLAASAAASTAASSAAAIRRWSTADMPQRQRLDYWVGAICEGFLEMTVSSPAASRFEASLDSARCGALNVNRVQGSAQDVYRTQAAITRSRANYFYLLCKQDSAWTAVQDGHSTRLLPDDVVLIDSRRLYEFHFPLRSDTVSIELPPEWLSTWLVDPGACAGQRIDGRSGWGRALSSFAQQLTPEAAVAAPLPSGVLCDQLGALLALSLGEEVPAGSISASACDALFARVRDALRERHAEPGLTVRAVASALEVSDRTVHRCLAAHDTTFARELTACRMAVARRLLGDPRFDRLTVAEIGRRVGLCDASHFVRQCRASLGGTPAALRRAR